MASAFSHAAAALGLGSFFYRREIPARVWIAGAISAVIPDLDVVGFRFGIHYGDFWGHRGFTHSLMFAALLAAAVTLVWFRDQSAIRPGIVFGYLFIATASHGLLDAMTDGGLGVAFFSPFDNTRYFLPWRPIHVSPISAKRFFTSGGLGILRNEFVWIWLPSIVMALCVWFIRRGPQHAVEKLETRN
jgi:inner membrane protein